MKKIYYLVMTLALLNSNAFSRNLSDQEEMFLLSEDSKEAMKISHVLKNEDIVDAIKNHMCGVLSQEGFVIFNSSDGLMQIWHPDAPKILISHGQDAIDGFSDPNRTQKFLYHIPRMGRSFDKDNYLVIKLLPIKLPSGCNIYKALAASLGAAGLITSGYMLYRKGEHKGHCEKNSEYLKAIADNLKELGGNILNPHENSDSE